MDQRLVQGQAEVADFPGSLGGAGMGGRVLAGGQGGHSALHEPEFAVGGRLEGPQVARLQAMALQLDAGPRHLQRVFVELAVDVPDQAVAQERFQQRDARPGFRPELLLAEPARPALQLGGELLGDDPRGDRDACRQVFRPFAPVDRIKVVLDDLERQVLVTLEGQDEAQPFDVVLGILPVAGRASAAG